MFMNRDERLKKSAFAVVSSALREHKGETISFLVGEPWYGPPAMLLEALTHAAQEDSGYSPPAGLDSFREVLAGIERARGVDARSENIVVGNGSKQLLFGLIALLCDLELSTPAPYYPGVANHAELLGLPLELLATNESCAKLYPDAIAAKRGGCLIISSPSNPTGEVYTEQERFDLVKQCKENGCVLIADEAYIDLVHNGLNCTFGTTDPELETTVLLRSFSKSLGICGWRMGYAVASSAVAARLAEWQGRALNPPSVLVQRCLQRYLTEYCIDCTAHQAHYGKVLKQLRSDLDGLDIPSVYPDGGFYLFIDLSEHLRKEAGFGSAEFCARLARLEGIGFWPGEDFGAPGWARISCGRIAPGQFEKLVGKLKSLLATYLWSNSNFH